MCYAPAATGQYSECSSIVRRAPIRLNYVAGKSFLCGSMAAHNNNVSTQSYTSRSMAPLQIFSLFQANHDFQCLSSQNVGPTKSSSAQPLTRPSKHTLMHSVRVTPSTSFACRTTLQRAHVCGRLPTSCPADQTAVRSSSTSLTWRRFKCKSLGRTRVSPEVRTERDSLAGNII